MRPLNGCPIQSYQPGNHTHTTNKNGNQHVMCMCVCTCTHVNVYMHAHTFIYLHACEQYNQRKRDYRLERGAWEPFEGGHLREVGLDGGKTEVRAYLQWCVSSSKVSPPRSSTTFPSSTTSWGPSFPPVIILGTSHTQNIADEWLIKEFSLHFPDWWREYLFKVISCLYTDVCENPAWFILLIFFILGVILFLLTKRPSISQILIIQQLHVAGVMFPPKHICHVQFQLQSVLERPYF